MTLNSLTQGQGAGRAAHDTIIVTIETTLKEGPRISDLDGAVNTTQVGGAIAVHLG